MSQIFEVISGNIVEGQYYEVIGGTSIVYNTVTYNAGTYFLGVTGVTTYSKTGGTEIVTFASDLTSQIIALQSTPPALLPDTSSLTSEVIGLPSTIVQLLPGIESNLPDQAVGYEDILYYFEEMSVIDYLQNNKNFIPAESEIHISHVEPKITAIFGTQFNDGINYADLAAFGSDPDVTLNFDTTNNIKSVLVDGILIFTAQR